MVYSSRLEVDARLQDTDDLVAAPVEHERTADDALVGAEIPLPEAVAQHDDPGRAGRMLLRKKDPAELRRRSQHLEEAACHPRGADPLRLPPSGDVQEGSLHRFEALERPALLLPGKEVLERDAVLFRLSIRR